MTLCPLNASEIVYSCSANMKTMIIAITQARESYDNLDKLYDLVGLKDPSGIIIASDLEVSNILRSVADNERNFLAWTQTSGIAKHRQFFFSCQSPPIVRQSGPGMFFCPPPPLHLKLGIVNKLMAILFAHSPTLKIENGARGVEKRLPRFFL